MLKYTTSITCESAKIEANRHNELEVELGFSSKSDLFEAVKDEIDAADLLEHIHLDGAVSAILKAYGEDEGFWPELERQADRLTLESVQNTVDAIDSAVDDIETQVIAIDANDPDDVQQVVRMVEKYIKTIRQLQLADLRP
jgi:hypothetical protein